MKTLFVLFVALAACNESKSREEAGGAQRDPAGTPDNSAGAPVGLGKTTQPTPPSDPTNAQAGGGHGTMAGNAVPGGTSLPVATTGTTATTGGAATTGGSAATGSATNADAAKHASDEETTTTKTTKKSVTKKK